MRKSSKIRNAIIGVAVAGLLAVGGSAVATGTASAAAPILEPPIALWEAEEIALGMSESGIVTKMAVNATSRAIIWDVKVQDGTTIHTYKIDGNTGRVTYSKDKRDSQKDMLRQLIAGGYEGDNSVPVTDMADVAVDAARGGYVRSATLYVNKKRGALEWTMTVEQGRRDPVVIIDVATWDVLSIRR